MKTVLSALCLLLLCNLQAQEKFNHFYKIKVSSDLTNYSTLCDLKTRLNDYEVGSVDYQNIQKKINSTIDIVILQKDTVLPFSELSEDSGVRKNIQKKLDLVKNGFTDNVELISRGGTKLIIKKEQALNPKLDGILGYQKSITPKLGSCCRYFGLKQKCVGNVLFDEDKVYINPWHFVNDKYPDDSLALYYKLKDGNTLTLKFEELTITTLALPIKYRFRDDTINFMGEDENGIETMMERDIPETFSTGINIALFGGYTFGSTKFNRRVKVKNREITRKSTFGLLLGTGTEKLTVKNTDTTEKAPKGSEEFTIGIASLGFGYVYSRNKLAIGAFYGWDFGVGSISNTWNYDNRPWIGIGLGYDIFKL